jgi:protein-L-isoaspartate(D-aspartate) O-methyltransferase
MAAGDPRSQLPSERQAERDRMVDEQLAKRGITDARVLEAMRTVPRHLFVPEKFRQDAYRDGPLGIGCEQTISQPYMVGVMTQLLEVKPGDRVLEIGTGSGYQAAVLAQLCESVVSIERHAELTASARANLEAAGITNVELVTGDGTEGYPPGAPYDAIIVTAGAPAVPHTLKQQLVDGGRMICPVGSREEQRLVKMERRGPNLYYARSVSCVFVPLVGAEGWKP